MSDKNSLYQVPQLTTTNFPTWKFKVESVLQDRGLWPCVAPPISASSKSPPIPPTAEQEQKALTQIRLTVSEEIIPLVRPCKTAKEAWEAICEQFEQKGISSRVSLKRQLFNAKWVDTVPMQTHINSLRSLALQLETVGSPVSDEDLAVVLLCSVGPRFDALVVQMEGLPPSDITFNFVSGRLLAELHRQNNSVAAHPETLTPIAYAMLTAAKTRGQRPKRSFCTYCNRAGHVAETCWDKEADEQGGQKVETVNFCM